MLRRRRTVLALVAMAVILVFAACGGQGAPTDVSGPAGDTAAGPQPGGELIFGRNEETETLDPQATTTVSSAEVDYLIYDTLVTRDFDMSIKPGLAEDWNVSDDGLVYTFHLKPDVKFHSGKPLTAQDVKFTFERWKNKEGSPTRYQIDAVSEIQVVDEHTVRFILSEPYAIFLDVLTGYAASILNEEFVTEVESRGQDYGTSPETVDGTGPFILKEWIRQDQMTLVRNDAYTWGPPIYENRGPAYLERVTLRVIPEDATRIAELEAGSIDFTPTLPPVEVSRLENVPDLNLYRYTDLNTQFIGFRLSAPILSDIRVRRAINHAINKEEVVEAAYYGLAEPASGPLAPNTWGWWPGVEDIQYRYDPEKAKQLLEEAGWTQMDARGIRQKDGQPLKILLMYSKGPTTDVLMPLIQEQLRQVGIDVTLREMEWTAYLAALRAGEHEMMLMGVRYTNADILYFYFHSKQRPAPNRFAWADPETDRLLEMSRTSTNDEERLKAYHDVQRIVVENAIWVPLVHEKRVVAAGPAVGPLKIHPANVLYKMLDVYKVR